MIANASGVAAGTAATVPSGFSSAGLPTGLQLIGPTYDDVAVFRAAADYERARPWRGRLPTVSCTKSYLLGRFEPEVA